MSNHLYRIRRLPGAISAVWASFTLLGVAAISACSSGVGGASSESVSENQFAHTAIDLSGFGPNDVGSGPKKPPKTSSTNCDAQFSPVISGGEITDLNATTAKTGCSNDFCKTTTLPSGGTGYVKVTGDNISADFPIPKGSITAGCPAIGKATVCPSKMSDGKAAAGCEATAADSNCETITLCPDPGGFEDSSTVRKITAPNLNDIRNLIPSGVTQSIPGEVNRALSKLGPMYVNPCEWDLLMDGATVGFDIAGNKGGQFATCTSDSECTSGRCVKGTGAHIFYGQCAVASSSTTYEREEGGSIFGIKLRAGLSEGRAQVKRAFFYPSTSFSVNSVATLRASAKIFGINVELLRNDLKSKLTECGYDFSWDSFSDGDDFSSLAGVILDGIESVGATVDVQTGRTQSSTPAAKKTACENALQVLRIVERSANERFHDALIASTFFNLTGGGGTVVTNRAKAQSYIDLYKTAVSTYRGSLADFDAAQRQALDHSIDARLFDFQIGLSLPFVRSYGIGPFKPGIEIGVFGRAGLQDVRLKSEASTHFTNSAAAPCSGVECMRIQATTSMMPHIAAGAYASVGGGFNLGLVGASIKVRGELNLMNVKLPMAGSFAIERTKRNLSTLLASSSDVPKPLRDFNIIPQLTASAFELEPSVAQFNAPVLIGGKLSTLEGVAADNTFLGGKVELIAEAKLFLVGKKRWKKTLFDWKGSRGGLWTITTPQGLPTFAQADLADAVTDRILAETGNPLFAYLGFIPAPNMALMPKLALVSTPGAADPASTASAIQLALDTKTLPNGLAKYASHLESDLGKSWTERSGANGRCSFLPIIH